MAICECGRTYFSKAKFCHKCAKQRKIDNDMNERQGGEGKPKILILLSYNEIHYLCQCTWVYDHNSKLHRLKYMNMACTVMYWHKQLTPLNGGSLSLI